MRTKAITQILDHLGSEYSKNWSESEKEMKIKTWSAILEDVTDEQGMIGLRKALESLGEFMPPVGKFKQMCLTGSGSNSLEDDGATSWEIVMKLNSSVAPIFKDNSIAEAVNRLGGWKSFWRSLTDANLAFKKKDFIQAYVMCRRQKQEFPPMPVGTEKFFSGGKNRRQYDFIGFRKPDEQRAAMKMIKQKDGTDRKMIEMMRGCGKEKCPALV